MATLASLVVKISGDTQELVSSLSTTQEKAAKTAGSITRSMGDAFTKMGSFATSGGNAMKGVLAGIGDQAGDIAKAGAAVAGLVGGFITIKDAIGTTQELTGEVSKLARVSGLTAEESSHLLFAFKQTGLGADDAGRAIGILAKKLKGISDDETGVLDGGRAMTAVFKDLGVDATRADGSIRPLNQLIDELADKFKTMPNGLEETGLAMQIFGKSGADLIPLLNQGSAGLKDLAREADKLGVTLSGKNLDQVKKLTAAQRDLKEATAGVKLQIGSAFVPAMTLANQVLVRLQPTLRRFISSGLESLTTAMLKIVTVALPPLVKGFRLLSSQLGFLKPVFAGLGVVAAALVAALFTFGPALGAVVPLLAPLAALMGALLSPVGLLLVGLGALAVVFRKPLADALKAVTRDLGNFVALIATAHRGDVRRAADLFNELPRPLQDMALLLATNKDALSKFADGMRNGAAAIADAATALARWIIDSGSLSTTLYGLQTVGDVAKAALDQIKDPLTWIMDNKIALSAAVAAIGTAMILAFTPVTGPVLLIVASMTTLLFTIGFVRQAWDDFTEANDEARDSSGNQRKSQILLEEALRGVGWVLKENANGWGHLIPDAIDLTIEAFYRFGQAEYFVIERGIIPALQFLKTQWDDLSALVRGFAGDFHVIGTAIADDFRAIADAVKAVVDQVRELYDWINKLPAIPDLVPNVGGFLGGLREKIPGGNTVPFPFSSGTPLVPRNMLAFLHKDERVVSAADNRQLTRAGAFGGGGGNVAYVTINSQGEQSEASAMRIARQVVRELAEELGFASVSGSMTPISAFSP